MRSQITLETKRNLDGTALVIVGGEVDISTIAQFRRAIEQVEESDPSEISVDLCAVNFIDTAGLAELLLIGKRMKSRDRPLRIIVTESGQPDYVLRTSGLDMILDIRHPE